MPRSLCVAYCRPNHFGGAHAINAYSPPSNVVALQPLGIGHCPLGFYRDGVTKGVYPGGIRHRRRQSSNDRRSQHHHQAVSKRDGEQPFYEETHNNIAFTDGRSQSPWDLSILDWPDFTGNVWLGMSIDVGPELLPRLELGPVPGAFVAEVALQIVPGAVLDIGELAVNGQQVIDENGRWVGPTIDAERLNGLTADNFIRADSADTMASELRFSDLIRPSGGGGGRNGIRWMDDAVGGFADSAWMQWVSANGEDTTLMIAVGDDPGDTIELRATGGVDVRGGLRVDGTPIPLPPAHLMDELSQVDGQGSGLDADRLDGLDATDFLRADRALNLAGDLRVGAHRITLGSGESQSLIHQQRQQNGDAALVVQQRAGHSIRLGLAMTTTAMTPSWRARVPWRLMT